MIVHLNHTGRKIMIDDLRSEEFFFDIQIEGMPLSLSSRFRSGFKNLILFLHGFACSKELFHHVWNNSEFDSYSLLALDFPGFGSSDKPENLNYSLETHATALEQVLIQLDEFNIHLVAHSMGGAIALLLPDDCLERINSFSNIEGNLLMLPLLPGEKRKPSFPRNQQDMQLFEEAQSASLETALQKTGNSLVEWSKSGDLLKRFQELKCRKAYFYGDDKGELRLKNELEYCNPIQISNSGHFIMNDNPYGFYTKLLDFINTKESNNNSSNK